MVRKLALAVSLALGGVSMTAHGLGLGDIDANSVLNQNFNADIRLLSAKDDELDSLKVRLASPEAFAKAGVERPFYLSMLRFAPRKGSDGNLYVKVTSDFPIREPYLNFLIELNWPNGRLVREYTVLLDPPTTVRRAPPPIAAPVRQVKAAPAPKAAPAKRPSVSRPAAAPRTASVAARTTPGEYGPVRSGETAWRIAENLRPEGASVVQTMMALHRANPAAFINNNINRLRRGQILRVPSRDEIMEMSVAEARQAFNESQRDSVVSSRPPAAVAKKPAPVEQVQPIAREPKPETVAKTKQPVVSEAESSRLKIATALPKEQGRAGAEGDATKMPDPASDSIQQQLLIAQENAETSRQEAENLRDRVDDLELQLRELQRLLTVRDDQFARIQAGVAAGESPEADVTGTDSAEPAVESEPAAGPAEQGLSEELEQNLIAAQQAADAAMEAIEGKVEPSTATTMVPEGQVMEETERAVEAETAPDSSASISAEGQSETVPAEVPEPAQDAAPVAESVPEPPVAEAPSTTGTVEPEVSRTEQPKPFGRAWLEQNWPFVAGGVGGLAGLGILLGLLLGRRNKTDGEEVIGFNEVAETERPTPAIESESEVDAAVAAVQKEYGDEGDSSEAAESFDEDAPREAAVKTAGSGVDPLSEADVYIAYGRYQQAEELLKAAVQSEPRRLDLKLKLLEVHYATRNRGAFVALAGQMAETGEDRIDVTAWDRVQEMGRELDPENALFEASAGSAGGFAAAAGLAAAGVAATSSVDDDELSLDDLEISELASDLNADDDIDDDMGADELDMALDLDELDADAEQDLQDSEAIDELESLDLEFPDLEKADGEASEVAETAGDEFERRKDDGLDIYGDDADEHSADAVNAAEPVDEESILNIDTDLDADELQAQLDELSDLSMLDTEMVDAPAADQSLDQPIDLEAALANLGGDSELSTEAFDSYAEPEDVNEEDVETKLDLARAYMEMGDTEGARSLLAEVQHEGNDDQKVAAVKLLAEVEAEA